MKASIPSALALLFAISSAHGAGIVPLGSDFIVAQNSTYEQKQPWVAADDNGDFVICYSWLKDVYFRRFSRDGVALGPEQLVNPTIVAGEQDETYISMDPVSGDFVIGWSDRHGNDGFQMGCGARFYRADGVPYSPEQIINTHTDLSQFEPYFAFAQNGTVLSAWADAGADGSVGCIGRLFDRFGTPLGGEILLNQPDPKTQIDPALSCNRFGTFVAAYVDAGGATGEPREVLARLYDNNGVPLGPQFLVNSVSTGMQRDPVVCMDGDGDFVVVFQDESGLDGDGFGVFARAFDATGTPKGPQFQVNTATTGTQRDPHVTMDYVGNFVITWEDNSTGDFDVKIRRYDRNANPLSGEIVVSSNPAGNQTYAKSALSQNGQRLVTVWFDDKSADALGRVFSLPVLVADKPATLGVTVNLGLELPGMGGEQYILLPSLSTSPGIPVSGGRVLALTPDPLFFLGVAFPNGGVFNGFVGNLDAQGVATATFLVPNDPAALGITLNFAAVTLKPASTVVEFLTDPLALTIQ